MLATTFAAGFGRTLGIFGEVAATATRSSPFASWRLSLSSASFLWL
jgi:hypothetical protein